MMVLNQLKRRLIHVLTRQVGICLLSLFVKNARRHFECNIVPHFTKTRSDRWEEILNCQKMNIKEDGRKDTGTRLPSAQAKSDTPEMSSEFQERLIKNVLQGLQDPNTAIEDDAEFWETYHTVESMQDEIFQDPGKKPETER